MTGDETLVPRTRSGTTSTIRTSSSVPLSIQTDFDDRTITTSSITKPSPIAPSLHHPKTVRFSIIEPPDITESVTNVSAHPVAGGGFSSIYRGEFEHPIKVIRVFENHRIEKIERRLAREMDVWWSLDHPNVVPLLGYVNDLGLLPSPVSQWYKNGDAGRYIRTAKVCEQFETRIKLLRDVSAGLQFLHRQDPAIIHGDLKPGNILIDDRGTARLCDFGLARVVEDGEAVFTGTVMCTVRYAAPELSSPTNTRKVAQTTRTDVYSLACVAYEFLYFKRPYEDEKNDQAMVILSYNQTPPASRLDEGWHPFTEPLVDSFWRLLENCWNRNEARRPNIDQFYGTIIHAPYPSFSNSGFVE
ncbi:hypothetical protein FRC17_010241 [Serendipita sp. 399]|nr:hypothetical protein FRC17_010241 [Serendipita sp. 399]